MLDFRREGKENLILDTKVKTWLLAYQIALRISRVLRVPTGTERQRKWVAILRLHPFLAGNREEMAKTFHRLAEWYNAAAVKCKVRTFCADEFSPLLSGGSVAWSGLNQNQCLFYVSELGDIPGLVCVGLSKGGRDADSSV